MSQLSTPITRLCEHLLPLPVLRERAGERVFGYQRSITTAAKKTLSLTLCRGTGRGNLSVLWLLVLPIVLTSCARTSRRQSTAPAAAPLASPAASTTQPHRTLTVCADPNNLPFSNNRGEG